MIERPTPGEQVAGIAGLALILTMFLFAWYGVNVPGVNGFDAFDAFDDWINIILVFAAFGGMALALAGSGSERSPVALSVVTTVLAGLGALVVLIYIISPPGVPSFGEAAVEIDMSREFGVFLGLIELVALSDRWLHGHAGGGRLLRGRRRSPLRTRRRAAAAAPARAAAPASARPAAATAARPAAAATAAGSAATASGAAPTTAAPGPPPGQQPPPPPPPPPARLGRRCLGRLGDPGRDLLGEGDDRHHRVDVDGGREERGVGDEEALDAADGAARVADPGGFARLRSAPCPSGGRPPGAARMA